MVNQEQRESAFLWTLDALKNEEIAVPIIAREFTPEDWAFIFEGLPKVLRFDLWQTLTEDKKAPILAAMRDDSREQLISLLSPQQLEDVVSSSSAEHLVEILDVLPNRIAKGLIKKLNSEESGRVQAALNYDDSQLGRYINHDVYTVNKRVNVSELLAEIKETLLHPNEHSILVVDEANHYLGQIDLNHLFKSSQDVSVM
ncbi:MAG: magnesium transporter, partial [Paraglaciecola sp.]|nr:magnesium transporter [Paraglaciecola sp.]